MKIFPCTNIVRERTFFRVLVGVSQKRECPLSLQEAAMNQGTFTASSSDPCVELDFVSVPLASFSFTSNMHTDTPLEMSVF